MDTYKKYTKIIGRIAELGLVQADVATRLDMHPTMLNHILRGRRPMPEGMEARIHAALDRLEAAERAADEARARVLAGEE